MIWKFDLGQIVKDVITNYTGIVVARAEYVNGNKKYAVMPDHLIDGQYPDQVWIDESWLTPSVSQLSILKAKSACDIPYREGQ